MDSDTFSPWPPSNGFQEFLLTLNEPRTRQGLDLWTQGTLTSLDARDRNSHHFSFVQLFEEHVVDEVALLSSVSPESAHALRDPPAGPLAQSLRDEFDRRDQMSATQAINLAYVLIAVARLNLADELLLSLRQRQLGPQDEFEATFATWLVDNRRSGAGSPALFASMRALIDAGGIPISRQIEACTQAAVWHAKRGDVGGDALQWFLERGKRIIAEMERRDEAPRAVISSWYRGVAMLRPELVDAQDVTSLMTKAGEALGTSDTKDVHQSILRRTLLQSKLKQHCYVTPDPEIAAATARALVAADPGWSTNWGDVAEMHVRFGQPERAAAAFDHAVSLGPPYVRYHLKSSAATWAKLGERGEATKRYLALSRIGRLPSAIAEEALGVAATEDAAAHFRTLLVG